MSSPDEFLVSYRVISATQQNSLLRKVSKECVAHLLLVSYSQNSRERTMDQFWDSFIEQNSGFFGYTVNCSLLQNLTCIKARENAPKYSLFRNEIQGNFQGRRMASLYPFSQPHHENK